MNRHIQMRPLHHRDAEQIALHFALESDLTEIVRQFPGVSWTRTHQCYYMARSRENIAAFLRYIKGRGIWVDQTPLFTNEKTTLSTVAQKTVDKSAQNTLTEVNETLVRRMSEKILLKGYSPSTLKNYRQHIITYLRALSPNTTAVEMTKEDIEQYLLRRYKDHPTSESEINMHINAIKFLYEQVLGKERMLFYLPRPEKPLQLPKVLGEHELERLFRAVSNLKHKAILLTAFSCGLRVSEVTRLRIRDIDSERMQVFIERSKGKKDRYVTLSPVLLDVLRKYISTYKPRPKEYLFEGQDTTQPYSARSAQVIFNRAVRNAGIHKKVTFHALRHSYATHLLEKGVDIKYIKELLGHFDIKTTERYLHVAREKLVHIQSPLDFLKKDI